MKKIFILIFSFFLLTNICLAQGKFSASISNVSNTIKFTLKPIGGDITAGLSTIEFFVRYPNASPAFTFGTVTANTTNFPGMTATGVTSSGSWEIEIDNPAYVLPGFHTAHFIYTGPAPTTTSKLYNNNVPYDVISVKLLGATNTVNLQFIHQDSEEKYYLAISDQNGADLRPAAFTNYFYPTTNSIAGPPGTTLYFANLNNVPIPVKFNGFTAIKKDNNGLLNWQVENESALTDSYVVERSLNGRDFSPITSVASKFSGNTGANVYDYTDHNVKALRSDIIYYRIKQLDKDGKFAYTEIRSIRLDGKAFTASVYPNPVVLTGTVNIDLVTDEKINIILTDAAGKEVQKALIEGRVGLNIYKLNMSNLAAGAYQLKVTAGNDSKVIPVVKSK